MEVILGTQKPSVSLAKRVEAVNVILAKRGVTARLPPVRVGLALDASESMKDLYRKGVVGQAVDRLLAIALKFDDDGQLDVWGFHDTVMAFPAACASDEGTYVKQRILGSNWELWGGTNYAPPISEALRTYAVGETYVEMKARWMRERVDEPKVQFGIPSTNASPAMLMFVTDGSCWDEGAAAALLEKGAGSSVYFNMVGLGNSRAFEFLRRMADRFGNVGFVNLASLGISDEALYESIVNPEFCEWLKRLPMQPRV